VPFTAKGFNFDEFKSGGLHEKHSVANWGRSQRILGDGSKARQSVSMWPVAGIFRMHTEHLASSRATGEHRGGSLGPH
jgi:hypothetical protein